MVRGNSAEQVESANHPQVAGTHSYVQNTCDSTEVVCNQSVLFKNHSSFNYNCNIIQFYNKKYMKKEKDQKIFNRLSYF